MSAAIVRVTYRWDDQPGGTPGWYCVAYDAAGEIIEDSMKVSFIVDADDCATTADLIDALSEAYPGAEIEEHGGAK